MISNITYIYESKNYLNMKNILYFNINIYKFFINILNNLCNKIIC